MFFSFQLASVLHLHFQPFRRTESARPVSGVKCISICAALLGIRSLWNSIDGGTGYPPRDNGGGVGGRGSGSCGDGHGSGGGGGWHWFGGFCLFAFLAFLGILKDQESEEPYR